MRRTIMMALFVVLLVSALSFAGDISATQDADKSPAQAAAKPWFDLDKCAFCNTMAAEPGLMEHMNTHYFDISNGIVSITHIDKDFQPAFARAQENMQKIVVDMQGGKMPYMCEHCTKVGEFHMMGVKFDEVHPDFGSVVIWASPDSATVAHLQAFGARNNEEMAKREAKARESRAD